ncbi:hypothetical protein [Peribacillus frigoritolerans]|uniref:hypothetical protein n=1 Tax=Peribacillus frigoritolerans TaxID=450367 RepID=UPI0024C1875F|nr:hypothetical protein [Peribacillus frigoritolerans]WHX62355.1 hypothetical protein QNH33_01715 [Peribacillus frigoritolerans]
MENSFVNSPLNELVAYSELYKLNEDDEEAVSYLQTRLNLLLEELSSSSHSKERKPSSVDLLKVGIAPRVMLA